MNQERRNLSKSFLSMAMSILLVAVSAFFIMNIVHTHMETNRLETILNERYEELSQLERDQVALQQQKVKLSDSEYIKDYARGNFMLSEENEQIFILPSKGN